MMRSLPLTSALFFGLCISALAQMTREIPDSFLPDATPAITNAKRMLANNEGGEAFPILESSASLGDVNAKFLVGFCLENGFGTVPDLNRARTVYREAAEKGHAAAQYGLGVLMLRTASDAEGGKEAVSWIERAAAAGIVPARRQLARIYLDGIVSPLRPDDAIAQLTKAAATGDPESHFALAQLTEKGAGKLEASPKKALDHYAAAAKAGHTGAMIYLGLGHQAGGLLKHDPAEAIRFFRRAAGLGDNGATFLLARAHAEGLGVDKNEARAAELYQKAADNGHIDAIVALAGMKVGPDAVALWKKAADAGSGAAMLRMSVFYRNGEEGMVKDDEMADRWILKAGTFGFAPAANAIGVMYRKGDRFPADPIAAAAWFARAADSGFAAAMVNLGDMFERGVALPSSYGTAGQWYQAAAEAGHPVGMYQMARLVEAGAGTAADPVKAYALYELAAARDHAPSAEAAKRLKSSLDAEQLAAAQKIIDLGTPKKK